PAEEPGAPAARGSARGLARWPWARPPARTALRMPRATRRGTAALRCSEAARPFRLQEAFVAAREDLVEEGHQRRLVARQIGANRQVVAGVVGAEATGRKVALGHDGSELAQELELARQHELAPRLGLGQ